jgi:hypothetical protein
LVRSPAAWSLWISAKSLAGSISLSQSIAWQSPRRLPTLETASGGNLGSES